MFLIKIEHFLKTFHLHVRIRAVCQFGICQMCINPFNELNAYTQKI